jgi:ribonuclease R
MTRDFTANDPTTTSSQKKILDLFAKKPKTRLTPIEIQKRAGFGRNDLQVVVDSLKDLAREGRIVRLKKNHYALPDGQNLVTGRVHAHPDGYGFLILEDKGSEDLYLSRREMRGVMHGERVMVRVDRKQKGGTSSRRANFGARTKSSSEFTANSVARAL